jgi:hypothetical protein
VHVDQFIVAGITNHGGGAGNFQRLAGNHGAHNLAFDEHVVGLNAGVVNHPRGTHMHRAAHFKRDVAPQAAIDLDALVAVGLKVAVKLGTFRNQAGNGAQAFGGYKACSGGCVHGSRLLAVQCGIEIKGWDYKLFICA